MSAAPVQTAATSTRIDLRMGAFVWWDLESTQVTPDHLRRVLTAEGLLATPGDEDGKYKVPDIDPVGAIKRACQEWGQGRGNADRFKAEVTAQEPGRVYVGILRHEREGQREVAWKQQETLCYDLTTKTWTNQFPSDQASAFMGVVDGFVTYLDHRWIRPFILLPELAKMKAIGLKKNGGFYFVALSQDDKLRRLKRVIGALGRSVLNIVTVENDADSRDAVANGTREHVLGQVAEIRATLKEWRDSSRKIRTDSQATALGQLAELLDIAGLYEGALEVSLNDLRGEIEGARADALALIAEKG